MTRDDLDEGQSVLSHEFLGSAEGDGCMAHSGAALSLCDVVVTDGAGIELIEIGLVRDILLVFLECLHGVVSQLKSVVV